LGLVGFGWVWLGLVEVVGLSGLAGVGVLEWAQWAGSDVVVGG